MNLNKLNAIIEQKGIKRKVLCDDMSISYGTLDSKLRGDSEFKWNEVLILKKDLGLSDFEAADIFFG